jgi:hypothetical protein
MSWAPLGNLALIRKLNSVAGGSLTNAQIAAATGYAKYIVDQAITMMGLTPN